MNFLICDDEKIEAERVETLLSEKGILKADDCVKRITPSQLLVDVEEGFFKDTDILISDIQFEGLDFDGIDIAKRINQKYPLCMIIFISNYVRYTEPVYDVQHVYFIRKEKLDITLARAVEKARKAFAEDSGENIIKVVVDRNPVYLNVKNIISIEREDRKVRIVTRDGEYLCNESLRNLAEKLVNTAVVRVSGNAMISISEISEKRIDSCIMKNGKKYDIGRIYRKKTDDAYMSYWKNRI